MISKIGFGGGCHWCTEAVFSSLKGIEKVVQGWVKSTPPSDSYSEGVIVHYDAEKVTLATLLKIHLETHASTSNHSMRHKYRSAVYYFQTSEKEMLQGLLAELALSDHKNYITQVLPFAAFKENKEEYLQYYEKHKEAPFCKRYIDPKISYLADKYPHRIKDK